LAKFLLIIAHLAQSSTVLFAAISSAFFSRFIGFLIYFISCVDWLLDLGSFFSFVRLWQSNARIRLFCCLYAVGQAFFALRTSSLAIEFALLKPNALRA